MTVTETKKVHMVGDALPNMPWEDKPEGTEGPVWRHSANPVVPRNPVKGVARIFNSAVVPYEGNSSVYSVPRRSMAVHTCTWVRVKMGYLGR